MKSRQNQPAKNRRDIGRVVSLIDTMQAARESSSCCVGVEARLETRDIVDPSIERRDGDRRNGD